MRLGVIFIAHMILTNASNKFTYISLFLCNTGVGNKSGFEGEHFLLGSPGELKFP
jgi:hypothetical protein